MDSILLCAGYATRLYPLTKNFPKPLLEVGGKPVISNIIEKLEQIGIENAYVVTNSRYYNNFQEWKRRIQTSIKITVIDDGTSREETKLGAIADMNLVIENKKINDKILVIAGDNMFDFSLKPMYNYFKKTNKTTISLIDVKDIEKLKKGGSVLIDKNNKIINLEEKAQNPNPKALYANCLYFFDKETISLIKQYIEQGNNLDQPGKFLQWLYKRKEIHGFVNKGTIIDIGTPETLENARNEFKY